MKSAEDRSCVRFSLAVMLILSCALDAAACPCGCGAVGPLLLGSGESWKFQVQISRDANRAFVMQNGRVGEEDRPDFTDNLRLGVASVVADGLSLSLQVPFHRNSHRDGGDDYSPGDPSMGGRYTVFTPDFGDFYLPQVQVHGAYKHAVAKGIIEKPRKPHSLDIHGNGVSELATGADFWFSKGPWSGGIGLSLRYKRSVQGKHQGLVSVIDYGLSDKEALSISYTFFGTGQVQLLFEREAKGEDHSDGLGLTDSDSLKHSVEISTNLRVAHQKTLNLALSQSGYQFRNKNTSRVQSFGMSYIQAI